MSKGNEGGESRRSLSLKRLMATAIIACLTISALALAACAPEEKEKAPEDDAAKSEEVFSTVKAADYTEVNAGPFTDTQYNREVLNAGNRGCAACHTDMYASIKNLTASSNEEYTHVIGEPGFGKNYGWRDCTACHMSFDAMAASPNLIGAIHSIHQASKEFKENGDCLSCHAYDAKGEWVLWDELKYSREVDGAVNTNYAINDLKNSEREIRNGNIADIVWDSEFTITDVALDQPLSTNEDGSEYTYAAVNMGLRHYDAEGYTITVSGVKGKNTWTIDEIKALPATDNVITQACGNTPGGPLISTMKATGVTLADFIEACGGVEDGVGSFNITCKDKWDCFGSLYDIETMLAQDAMLVYAYNDHDLTAAQGYPIVFNAPGFVGFVDAKYIESIDFKQGPGALVSAWGAMATDSNMNAGFFNPVKDGMEVKVGEEVRLSGWVYETNSGGHYSDKIAFSSDYGDNWTYIDIEENLADYDNSLWVTWEGTWVPEKPGTYVLHCKVVDNLNPDVVPVHPDCGLPAYEYRWDAENYAHVIIKVTE